MARLSPSPASAWSHSTCGVRLQRRSRSICSERSSILRGNHSDGNAVFPVVACASLLLSHRDAVTRVACAGSSAVAGQPASPARAGCQAATRESSRAGRKTRRRQQRHASPTALRKARVTTRRRQRRTSPAGAPGANTHASCKAAARAPAAATRQTAARSKTAVAPPASQSSGAWPPAAVGPSATTAVLLFLPPNGS
jgi:hypothetical protein